MRRATLTQSINNYLRWRPTSRQRIALVDGDVIVYRCGFAAEKGSEPEPFEQVVKAVDYTLESIRNGALATHMEIYLTGTGNYREQIATIKPYKGNRADAQKPYHYDNIRGYLLGRGDTQLIVGREADDALGSRQCNSAIARSGYETVICTIDKDLMMIPGWHYNWTKVNDDGDYGILKWVSDWEALRSFYTQLLTGDPVDNIPGIKGVGPKKAQKALEDCRTEAELYQVAREMYAKAYENSDEALLENGRLLWIQREPNQMWEPPSSRRR